MDSEIGAASELRLEQEWTCASSASAMPRVADCQYESGASDSRYLSTTVHDMARKIQKRSPGDAPNIIRSLNWLWASHSHYVRKHLNDE